MLKKRATKRKIRQLSYQVPRLKWLYRACKMYVDNYRGVNNSDMQINGELHLLKKLGAAENSVFIDVGANHGQWTAAVLAHYPTVNIHCFEPVPPTYERLKAKNFPPNVTLNQLGLGATAGTATMYLYRESSEINSMYAHRAPTEETAIPITTLDDYCHDKGIENIHFLKIDVEGHDFAVLQGASQLFAEGKIQVTQFEYGANWIIARHYLKDVFDLVGGLPYQLYRLMPSGLLKIPVYAYALDTFEPANYLIVHDDFQFSIGLKITG